jgi:primosomal protein N' (replication factor Y)
MTKIIYQILLPIPYKLSFSYFSADNLSLAIGDVVLSPFRNKELFGVVVAIEQNNYLEKDKIKTICFKENRLTFSQKLLKFIDFVANYNLVHKGLILKLSLSILNSSKEPKRQKIEQKKLSKIQLKSLSKEQQKAADFLLTKIDNKSFLTILLDGVTGSGKTEIYFQAIAQIINSSTQDAQILILLPEITLTSQLCQRFLQQFGFEPDLWHSKISSAKKRNLFFKIADGSSRVIIGARSALFLPFKNLQLIIVDEEHDKSFKQEDNVCYHGRDMAIIRAKIENIVIILSSATPSLESYLNAQNQKYQLIKLDQRFGQEKKTSIDLIDMRKEKLAKNHFISNKLKTLLIENLSNNRQSLLFLNRRGYAPITLCKNCGQKFSCKDCSSYLTFHKNTNILICHYCGKTKKPTSACFNCGKKDCLINCGVGVERLQEEVLQYLPAAKIALMTSDNIKNNNDAQDIITKIIENKIDIIIGTQMVAKGHHFPFLSLVGIVDGDGSFASGNLRTLEYSFQLLTQVIGRAGRESYQGRVVLQTYNSDNKIFKQIIENKRDEFLMSEIKNRRIMKFPPFSKMAKIIIAGANENKVIDFSKFILNQFPINPAIEVFGPAPM